MNRPEVVAIGDVHGCASLLEQELNPHLDSGAELIWIRRPFLSRPHGLPYTVVHGHTFRHDFKVTRLPHRIGIDTGAYLSGVLTFLALSTGGR
jgi:serine/threonine protein phosphatase 1